MKQKISICTLLLIINLPFLTAQQSQIIGESGDGKTIKLIWFFKTWDKEVTGFDIKRRSTGNIKSDWQKLNSATILPSISVNKNLELNGVDAAEAARINQKLVKLIQSKKVNEISAADYLQKLRTDDKALRGLSFAIALDFDFALINGFAFYDRTPASGQTYEYGLFLVKGNKTTSKEECSFTWESGSVAPLNPKMSISAKWATRQNKLQLNWTLNEKMSEGIYLAGFNVYRKTADTWTKLTTSPSNLTGKNGYIWWDSMVSQTAPTVYGVTLQSIFGNEGKRTEFTFNPNDYPQAYHSPDLEEVGSSGVNFEGGFALKWKFPKEQEQFIKGFVIEKANLPEKYKELPSMLPPRVRNQVEKSHSVPASYVTFRIVAVYNDGTRMAGNEKMLYYLPEIKAPKPTGLTAKWRKAGNTFYADLSWNTKKPEDTLSQHYQIYASNPVNGKFAQEQTPQPVKTNQYSFPLNYSTASKYKFCVAAVNRFGHVGWMSDTALLFSPSQSLPFINFSQAVLDSNRVSLLWNYGDIWDLKGFRIYQNGNLVASEYELKKEVRNFKTPGLKWNVDYNFTIQAVSVNGVVSEISIPTTVYISKPKRK